MLSTDSITYVLKTLYELHPEAECELRHSSNFELLISTVLSAQATDKKVNEITNRLYKKYNTPESFLKLTVEELEQEIKEIGLYKSKAKNILSLCKSLIEEFHGEVPNSMEKLTSLAGVGRKTANVVLSNAFGVPALAVDTHVFRVSNRIGLASAKNVGETEEQLMRNIPKEQWIKAHHTLIFHGRRVCDAKKPKCSECPLTLNCEYYKTNKIETI